MAKELPYFQFEPAEYLTKDVSFCSLAAQGLFINICAYYWQRECNLTKSQLLRRLNYPNELQELIDEGVINLDEDVIKVKFLDAQYENATSRSKTNSSNGKKGGRPKKLNPIKTETKAKLNQNQSETKGIREDKIKEDKIKRENDFNIFWSKYPRKVEKKDVREKFLKLKQTEIDDILNTIDNFVKYKPFDSYVHPNPKTYINKQRWNDEIIETKTKPLKSWANGL